MKSDSSTLVQMSSKIYPAHVCPNYHIWPKSPYIVILFHGQNPHGHKYCEQSFYYIIRFLNAAKISNILYYRNYTYTYDHLLPFEKLTETRNGRKCQKTEIYNPEYEFKAFEVEIQKILTEFNVRNPRFVLVGHSLGGLYAAIFGTMIGLRCIKTISLDGFNFYEVIPFFMREHAHMGKIDESKLEYHPTKLVYKGEQVDLEKLWISQKLYEMAYRYRDVRIENHYLIDYFENKQNPVMTSVTKMPKDIHYPKKYAIKYGDEYYHSLHCYIPIAEVIVNQFILNDK